MSDSHLISVVNDYKTHSSFLPRYRYARIPLNNLTGSSVPIGISSNTMMEFKIPARTIINLSQSYVSYSYTLAAVAANYAVTHEIGQDLASWVYFGDGGGLGVVDLNNADRYSSVIRNIRTQDGEYMSNDLEHCNYPCNQLSSQNILPFSRDGLNAGVMCASTTSYLEPQYLNISPAINTALTNF